jgi:hypothetical protein
MICFIHESVRKLGDKGRPERQEEEESSRSRQLQWLVIVFVNIVFMILEQRTDPYNFFRDQQG